MKQQQLEELKRRELERQELERSNDYAVEEIERVEWLERAAWRLAVHDMHADKRERLPSCMELSALLDWFREYKPELIELARKAFPKIIEEE